MCCFSCPHAAKVILQRIAEVLEAGKKGEIGGGPGGSLAEAGDDLEAALSGLTCVRGALNAGRELKSITDDNARDISSLRGEHP